MNKYYILDNDNKKYIDKIKDGFLTFEDTSYENIDLAIVKEVYREDENNEVDKISIHQYLIMTEQLGQGNEWEVNKWIIYLIFPIICFIINFGFGFVGAWFTLYTIPTLLVTGFCSYQLFRINKKKMAVAMIVLILLSFTAPLIGNLIFNNYDVIRTLGGTT
jgi:hypothetical protein